MRQPSSRPAMWSPGTRAPRTARKKSRTSVGGPASYPVGSHGRQSFRASGIVHFGLPHSIIGIAPRVWLEPMLVSSCSAHSSKSSPIPARSHQRGDLGNIRGFPTPVGRQGHTRDKWFASRSRAARSMFLASKPPQPSDQWTRPLLFHRIPLRMRPLQHRLLPQRVRGVLPPPRLLPRPPTAAPTPTPQPGEHPARR